MENLFQVAQSLFSNGWDFLKNTVYPFLNISNSAMIIGLAIIGISFAFIRLVFNFSNISHKNRDNNTKISSNRKNDTR